MNLRNIRTRLSGRPLRSRTAVNNIDSHVTPVPKRRSWDNTAAPISYTFQEIHSPITCPYDRPVEAIREMEYPHMNNGVYLDHSGTTIYAQSTVERFAKKMSTSLLGNPHSANEPAKLSGDMVDDVRLKALRFLGADPRHFDLVFVANATAAIKLVADSFRDLAEQTRSGSFWYGYHRDAHTSIIGVRELANGEHKCFESDEEVDAWLDDPLDPSLDLNRRDQSGLGLFGYPGQSNLTGRRLPVSWTRRLRASKRGLLRNTYSLFDAAALAMTSPMEHVFGDPDAAPDFTCVSFYKIFGFPDLGGLVVRKDSGHILALRKYFGGGTVSLVSTIGSAWHMSKGLESTSNGGGGSDESNDHGNGGGGGGGGHGGGGLHEGLEDGTLPFHSILALGEAIEVHRELYGSMKNISRHTTQLVKRMYSDVSALRYRNGQPLCNIYNEEGEVYGDAQRQGATIAFNVFRADGTYESYAAVEKLANERGIYIRSGGVCNPGGVFTALKYEQWQLNRARSAGHHCGSNGLGVINELPTG
ncbi:pyridoxal phosphate-dependent transferase [Bombardia bombarda]|uniref:Pyridoxal phosphate-dependent transferase n=1 Tax=Bombardia bombarda TaxID=252184 RepID=A0AA40BY98_9PEZI|nr:pyridoxal phosphate-dependent transferase [Bombardia bombarda]